MRMLLTGATKEGGSVQGLHVSSLSMDVIIASGSRQRYALQSQGDTKRQISRFNLLRLPSAHGLQDKQASSARDRQSQAVACSSADFCMPGHPDWIHKKELLTGKPVEEGNAQNRIQRSCMKSARQYSKALQAKHDSDAWSNKCELGAKCIPVTGPGDDALPLQKRDQQTVMLSVLGGRPFWPGRGSALFLVAQDPSCRSFGLSAGQHPSLSGGVRPCAFSSRSL